MINSFILTHSLREIHKEAGLSLEQNGSLLLLVKGGTVIKSFDEHVPIKEIHEAADEFVLNQQADLIEDALDKFARCDEDGRGHHEYHWNNCYDREDIKNWLRRRNLVTEVK